MFMKSFLMFEYCTSYESLIYSILEDKIMTKQRKAMLMMVITACLWSIGGIFLKLVSWNAFLITGSRSLLAAGVLGGYMYFSKTKFKINKYSSGFKRTFNGTMIAPS